MSAMASSPVEPPPSRFAMPDPQLAVPGEDLIAVGADLEPGTVLAAYRSGLFPMPVDPQNSLSKVAWYSPDPRGIIPLNGFQVSRSLRRSCKRYEIRTNTAFAEVVTACANPDRDGGWITSAFIDAYEQLHEMGWAHSIETWSDGKLVGGLYGLRIGGLFAGESMFHTATDASKVALVHLVDHLVNDGAILLDTQWTTNHLASLGAIEVSRQQYLQRLGRAVGSPSPRTG
jgi:leucyl/phenylalanyl-tRNA--protein transferase